MSALKLAEFLPGNKIGFTYDPEEAMECVGPEEFDKLIPVILLRAFELESVARNIELIKEELELIAPRGL